VEDSVLVHVQFRWKSVREIILKIGQLMTKSLVCYILYTGRVRKLLICLKAHIQGAAKNIPVFWHVFWQYFYND